MGVMAKDLMILLQILAIYVLRFCLRSQIFFLFYLYSLQFLHLSSRFPPALLDGLQPCDVINLTIGLQHLTIIKQTLTFTCRIGGGGCLYSALF